MSNMPTVQIIYKFREEIRSCNAEGSYWLHFVKGIHDKGDFEVVRIDAYSDGDRWYWKSQ